MTRVLVAGIGNIFFGDDGFGVEVARQLASTPPPGASVIDFGIRGVHLAYELLVPTDLLVVIDLAPRGGAPGSLYLIDPAVDAAPARAAQDAHGMNLPAVFDSVLAMGGQLPTIRIVGCEPEAIEARLGLSPRVAAAVPLAMTLVRTAISSQTIEPQEPS